MTLTRRNLLAAVAVTPLIAGGAAPAPLILNDSSRLNPVRIGRRVRLGGGDGAVIEPLRAALKAARDEGRPFCVGGARHSQGGQSLPVEGGVAADMTGAVVEIDRAAATYRVGAGARWGEVVAALDAAGLSPAVMQSSRDFAVGAAVSVNAHGWPAPRGPVGSTIRALRLMLADGSVLRCSRTENAAIFAQVIGGYGLLGVVIDVELNAVANEQLRPRFARMPASDFAARFVAEANGAATRMIYGRLDMRRGHFLEEALLCVYQSDGAGPPEPLQPDAAQSSLAKTVFRAQTGSEAGRSVRWFSEAEILPQISGSASRNSLLNTPVSALGPAKRGSTDILHEYFLPPQALEAFLAECRRQILGSGAELLNITLRYVAADDSSLMGYAPEPRIAAVLFFSQPMTDRAERVMHNLTVGLIQASLALGGSFYLPYRLHARPEQLRAAYPRIDAFVVAKLELDPQLLFRNLMWDHYFS